MIENGLFVLSGPEMQLHDILWAVHDRKIMVEARARKNIREFPVMVGGRGPSDARFSRTRTRVSARRWALTEPEQGVRLLNPSNCTAGYALLNASDRVIPLLLLLTEADRCYLWMNSERCWGVLDEQFLVRGWMNRTPW